jgi:hypothetical protein
MLVLIAAAATAILIVYVSSDPEYVQIIKGIVYSLVKAGYNEDKILEIMRFYV